MCIRDSGITVEGYEGNGKEPLYIVDGKEVTPSVMSALNPDKIERVTAVSYTHLDVYKRQVLRCGYPVRK